MFWANLQEEEGRTQHTGAQREQRGGTGENLRRPSQPQSEAESRRERSPEIEGDEHSPLLVAVAAGVYSRPILLSSRWLATVPKPPPPLASRWEHVTDSGQWNGGTDNAYPSPPGPAGKLPVDSPTCFLSAALGPEAEFPKAIEDHLEEPRGGKAWILKSTPRRQLSWRAVSPETPPLDFQ